MLTSAQQATLKTAIIAQYGSNANVIDFSLVRDYFNATGAIKIWRKDCTIDDIRSQVTWANLTPTDAADGTQTWANRSLACQGKQFNLQMLLTAPTNIVPGDIASFRNGLQDALTGIPSGVAGAALAANWVGVRDTALQRFGSRLELLFVTPDGVAQKCSAYGLAVDTGDCSNAFYS